MAFQYAFSVYSARKEIRLSQSSNVSSNTVVGHAIDSSKISISCTYGPFPAPFLLIVITLNNATILQQINVAIFPSWATIQTCVLFITSLLQQPLNYLILFAY